MRRLIAWDSAAGANVINDRRYFITNKPFSMQINGISDVPVHASAIGMTPFGKALLVEGKPISSISQTAMYDQGFDFFSWKTTHLCISFLMKSSQSASLYG